MAGNDKRKQITSAIERLLGRFQLQEITTDDIANEAQVGKGTIYRYFEDKDDLFFQAASAGFVELCLLLEQWVGAEGPVRAQLVQAAEQISSFFLKRRQLLRMMHVEDDKSRWENGERWRQWQERRGKMVSAVARIMKRGIERGDFRDGLDPDVMATYFLGMVRARNRDMTQFSDSDRDLESLVDLFYRGVRRLEAADGNKPARDALQPSEASP